MSRRKPRFPRQEHSNRPIYSVDSLTFYKASRTLDIDDFRPVRKGKVRGKREGVKVPDYIDMQDFRWRRDEMGELICSYTRFRDENGNEGYTNRGEIVHERLRQKFDNLVFDAFDKLTKRERDYIDRTKNK